MKESLWKWLGISLVALAIGFYTAYVAECYWNWFAVSAFHVQEISFLQMLGIIWLIQLVMPSSSTGDDKRWEALLSMVELCVPDERRRALDDLKGDAVRDFSLHSFFLVFAQIGMNTLMLTLGFVLHIFVL